MISECHRWRKRLRSQVARWTVPREAILKVLLQTSKHMSAKEIYATLHKIYPGIGLTTVYRTLDLLSRVGVISKLSVGNGHTRYEYKSDEKKEHHHHLICNRCGKIIDYSDFLEEELELVRKTEENLAKKYNFTVQDHNIEFYGLCSKCK